MQKCKEREQRIMDYNWKKIKEQILACSKVAFVESGIMVSDLELEDCVTIFNNFIHLNTPYLEIANLRHDITRNLQESCVSEIGRVESLKNLCTNIDTFLKKLLPYLGIKNYEDVKCDSEMSLLRATGLWGTRIPDFNATGTECYRNDNTGLFILGHANLTRNALVHTSPAWDIAEVTQKLRYVLSLYIFFIFKFKTQFLAKDKNLANHDSNHFDENPEFALLYDYISYGNSSMEIKRRYISTFVKHQLYRIGEILETELISKMMRFSENSINNHAAKRILGEMEKNNAIVPVKHFPKKYDLTGTERERINEAQINYNTAIQNYNSSIQDIINQYQLTMTIEELNELVMSHLEAQYNYDIEEAIGDAGIAEKEDYKKFAEHLKQAGCPEDKCKDLYDGLLCINRDNDILVRISAGKAFRKISDPGQFNEYVRRANRDVWLDTQILLYLLCQNDDYSAYNIPYFKTAIAFFRQSRTNSNFHFKVPSFYLNEVIYQLRQALLLIAVVDQPFAKGKKLSQNVFYRHYCHLHSNDGLPVNVETFSDYMEHSFNLYEEDAFETDCDSIIAGIVREKFDEYKIVIEEITHLSNTEISNSEKLFVDAAKEEGLIIKQGKPLHNDAIMGSALFKNTDDQKPIFITLDGCFEPYRKMFVKRYMRTSAFNWHLFSPSAFVNHLDFIDFKVNPDNLTDDLISMVETSEMKDKTLNFIDRFNRFLDIPLLTSNQRKKYIAWVGDLFKSKEYSYKPEASNEEMSPQLMRFMEAQDSVFNYFYEQKGNKVKEFQVMLRNEAWFKKYIQLLSEFSKTMEATKEDLFVAMEGNLETYNNLEE